VARGSAELLDKFGFLNRRLIQTVEERMHHARRDLVRYSPINALNRYQDRLELASVNVSRRRQHITNCIERLLAANNYKVKELKEKLYALGPDNVMARGFSVLRTLDGKIVTRAENLNVGDRVQALLRSGKITLKVESIEK